MQRERYMKSIKRIVIIFFFISIFSQVITAPKESIKNNHATQKGNIRSEKRIIVNTQSPNHDQKPEENLININNADKLILMTLPGIGDALADRIIVYRNKHMFLKESDIMFIRGIGQRKYENIKHLIKVK